jgi:hypothetical protein
MLLVAAADDSGDLSTMRAAAERLEISATAADGAEELGLIEIDRGRVRFRHPLVRSAVYQSAAAPLRRRAHGALAACPSGEWQADRRDWHRAGADEDVGVELVAMAERARARSGYAVAARALERSAQITPAPERRVARRIAAAHAFWLAGRGSHAEELLTAALAEVRDPLLRADADHLLGRQVQWRGDPAAARDILVAGALAATLTERATAGTVAPDDLSRRLAHPRVCPPVYRARRGCGHRPVSMPVLGDPRGGRDPSRRPRLGARSLHEDHRRLWGCRLRELLAGRDRHPSTR